MAWAIAFVLVMFYYVVYTIPSVKAIEEVPPGGHFFGAEHTLERYAHAFYAPSSRTGATSSPGRRPARRTRRNAPTRPTSQLRASYEQPAMAPERLEAIDAFIAKREEEIRDGGSV